MVRFSGVPCPPVRSFSKRSIYLINCRFWSDGGLACGVFAGVCWMLHLTQCTVVKCDEGLQEWHGLNGGDV